jgi:hypothetical protein
MPRFKVFEWNHIFKNSHELENDMHSEQAATLWNKDNVRQVQEIMCSLHHQAIEMTAEKFGILVGKCLSILSKD